MLNFRILCQLQKIFDNENFPNYDMYVCVHVRMCVGSYVCMYLCICIHVCMHACMHSFIKVQETLMTNREPNAVTVI